VEAEDPGAEEEKVMDSLLTMIHSLMANAENFLLHGSISERGGFAIAINGIKVFKVQVSAFFTFLFHKKGIRQRVFSVFFSF
jgi:hypothetical protein